MCCPGAGPVSGQRERHAVSAQALEQADPEGPGALHTYAAVAQRRAEPERAAVTGPATRYTHTHIHTHIHTHHTVLPTNTDTQAHHIHTRHTSTAHTHNRHAHTYTHATQSSPPTQTHKHNAHTLHTRALPPPQSNIDTHAPKARPSHTHRVKCKVI